MDGLAGLLDDWRTHLRAKGRRPETIKSYLDVGRAFCAYLAEKGMPTSAASVKREHVETYLADLADRTSAANTAKHYRSRQQLFKWLAGAGRCRRPSG